MSRIGLNRGLPLAALGTLGVFVMTFGCKHSAGLQSGAPDGPASLELSQKADVQMAVGRTLEGRGQTREAVAMFTETVKNDPRRADAWVRLAVNSDKEGMFVESADYYQKALELDPRNADTYCNLGYSLYLQERLADAESALRRALELKPDHARAQNNLGLVLARGGRADESLRSFQQAGGTEADAHSNLAYGLTLRGAMKEASAHYEQAVAMDPKAEAAKKGRSELAVVTSKLEQPAAEPAPVVQTRGTAPPAKVVPLIAPLK